MIPASYRSPLALLALAGGLLVVAASSAYTAARFAASPSAVGNVDIRRILDKIQQRGEMEIELTQMGNKFEQELKSRKEQLETRARESDAITDPAERQKLRDELALEQLQLTRWETFKQQEVDRERAFRWESLYRLIVAEGDKLAQSEGYQYVLVYDGTAEFQRDRRSQAPLAQQVFDQIARRRVLYASKADDLTEKLILRMNNARATPGSASGSAKPAAPATPSTPTTP